MQIYPSLQAFQSFNKDFEIDGFLFHSSKSKTTPVYFQFFYGILFVNLASTRCILLHIDSMVSVLLFFPMEQETKNKTEMK